MNDRIVFYTAGVVTGIVGVLIVARPLTKMLNALNDKLEGKAAQ